jgi:hypothetical protein
VHGGTAMAEDSPIAARKYCGHPPALMGEVPVTHRVHPAMNAMQSPGLHSHLDCPMREARGE